MPLLSKHEACSGQLLRLKRQQAGYLLSIFTSPDQMLSLSNCLAWGLSETPPRLVTIDHLHNPCTEVVLIPGYLGLSRFDRGD